MTRRSRKSSSNTSRFAAVRLQKLCPLISTDIYFSLAKEDRQLYTLKSPPAATTTPLTSDAPIATSDASGIATSDAPIATSDTPITPASNPPPPPQDRNSGPTRTKRQSTSARMRTGPLPAALKARVLANTSKKSTTVSRPLNNKPPVPQPPEDLSDSGSNTLVPSNPELAASPTDAMSVDEEVLPVADTSGALCDSVIQVNIIRAFGTSTLVETLPPTLLYVDKDERPQWLITSIREFLQHGPYYLCLSEVVDLFLAQEARLGYPAKVKSLISSLSLSLTFLIPYSPFVWLSLLEIDPQKSPCS